jgi:hypothetical protein
LLDGKLAGCTQRSVVYHDTLQARRSSCAKWPAFGIWAWNRDGHGRRLLKEVAAQSETPPPLAVFALAPGNASSAEFSLPTHEFDAIVAMGESGILHSDSRYGVPFHICRTSHG